MEAAAAESGVAARVTKEAEEVDDKAAKVEVVESAHHPLGDEERQGRRSDEAARTWQDPPVQAGRQESTMGTAEGREAARTWRIGRAARRPGWQDTTGVMEGGWWMRTWGRSCRAAWKERKQDTTGVVEGGWWVQTWGRRRRATWMGMNDFPGAVEDRCTMRTWGR